MLSFPHSNATKPPWGAALSARQSAVLFRPSAFRELFATSRLVQAHLLALDLARIARDEPRLREGGLQGGVVFDERPGDAVAYGSGLSGLSPTEDVHHDVESLGVVGEFERLAH